MRSLILRAAALVGGAARYLRSAWPGLAGAALVCSGVALIYVPAAVVVAGLFLLLLDWRD
jgi:hypothetical protein